MADGSSTARGRRCPSHRRWRSLIGSSATIASDERLNESWSAIRRIIQGIPADVFELRLKGEKVRASARHGKHLFIVLRDAMLAMHFGMNGSLQFGRGDEPEPTYTRLRLRFAGGDCLAYINPRRLGGIALCTSIEGFVSRVGLGLDVLDDAFDLRAFTAVLAGGKRDVKSVLMDQRLMAGIGNIYSDEILFQARIQPRTVARSIGGERAARLFRSIHETLETAIRCGAGSERYAERLPKGFLLPQRHRSGHCPRCGTMLTTCKVSARTSYYCPHCQPD